MYFEQTVSVIIYQVRYKITRVKVDGARNRQCRENDMTRLIVYLFEAEDSGSGGRTDAVLLSYEELTRILGILKTLFWFCTAILLSVGIGNL